MLTRDHGPMVTKTLQHRLWWAAYVAGAVLMVVGAITTFVFAIPAGSWTWLGSERPDAWVVTAANSGLAGLVGGVVLQRAAERYGYRHLRAEWTGWSCDECRSCRDGL